jgi:hypothetical protein
MTAPQPLATVNDDVHDIGRLLEVPAYEPDPQEGPVLVVVRSVVPAAVRDVHALDQVPRTDSWRRRRTSSTPESSARPVIHRSRLALDIPVRTVLTS